MTTSVSKFSIVSSNISHSTLIHTLNRPVKDTFKMYLDTDTFSKKYLVLDTLQKKYLDTDTFKILSEQTYLDTFKILSEKSI